MADPTAKDAPDDIDRILENAIGCVVTVAEHKRLSAVDQDLLGWDRYRAAGVGVYDTQTKQWIVPKPQ